MLFILFSHLDKVSFERLVPGALWMLKSSDVQALIGNSVLFAYVLHIVIKVHPPVYFTPSLDYLQYMYRAMGI
jgi:hypothetical protein